MSSSVDSSDIATINLALQTLANFRFFINESQARQTRLPPYPFMNFCLECSTSKYLCHENVDIRMNAVAAVVSLMRPYIPVTCTSSNQTKASAFGQFISSRTIGRKIVFTQLFCWKSVFTRFFYL